MFKRSDFPILKQKIKGRTLVYFDNSATAQKPSVVIKMVEEYYRQYNSNVHRSLNPLAELVTKRYEEARDEVAEFINSQREEIIFTRGATEGINLVARTWGENNLKSGDIVVLSILEHHANIVPWLQLKEKLGIKISYIPLQEDGSLNMTAAKKLLSKKRVKLLAISQASNVLGILNPLKKLISWARQKNIVTLVDAAQSIAHVPVDVRDLNCDFLVFSGHKIWGPTGVGVLYGRRNILENMPPFLGGGDMIGAVYQDSFTINELPYKFEAGTPNIAGVIGLASAIRYIKKAGWKNIVVQEKKLSDYFMKKVGGLKFVKILGTAPAKFPVFAMVIDNIHPHDAADILGTEGIIMRAGNHCTQPLHDYLKVSATLRASLSFYNTTAEIDFFVKKLQELKKAFK